MYTGVRRWMSPRRNVQTGFLRRSFCEIRSSIVPRPLRGSIKFTQAPLICPGCFLLEITTDLAEASWLSSVSSILRKNEIERSKALVKQWLVRMIYTLWLNNLECVRISKVDGENKVRVRVDFIRVNVYTCVSCLVCCLLSCFKSTAGEIETKLVFLQIYILVLFHPTIQPDKEYNYTQIRKAI